MPLRRFFALGLTGLLLLAAACQRTATTTTNAPPDSPAATANANATFATGNANTANSVSQTTTVVVSRAGLQPAVVTVSAGGSVTFQNTDSVLHEITSDPHPVHTDVPGFDVLLSPGTARSFAFTAAGTWGYHDHQDPFTARYQGTVTVTP